MLYPALPLSTMLQMFSPTAPFTLLTLIVAGVLVVGIAGLVLGLRLGFNTSPSASAQPVENAPQKYSA